MNTKSPLLLLIIIELFTFKQFERLYWLSGIFGNNYYWYFRQKYHWYFGGNITCISDRKYYWYGQR